MRPFYAVVVSLFLLGCGKKTVNVTANFVNGPSSKASTQSLSTQALTAGQWLLSPDKATVTITGFRMLGGSNSDTTTLSGCSITYDKSQPSLAPLSSCTLPIPAGTYTGISITVSGNVSLLFNDSANGIYSDPSQTNLLTTTAPAGGAQMITTNIIANNSGSCLTCPAGQTFTDSSAETYFASPLTVSASSIPTINVLIMAAHQMRATVSGGNFSSKPFSSGGIALQPIVGTTGKVEFYSSASTIGNVAMPNGAPDEHLVIYADSKTPTIEGGTYPGFNCPGQTSTSTGDGAQNTATMGYLGLSSGSLAWIEGSLPSGGGSIDYTHPWAYVTLTEATSVGGSATLKIQCTSTPPAPTDGKTYSSGGATSITSPDYKETLTLLAD